MRFRRGVTDYPTIGDTGRAADEQPRCASSSTAPARSTIKIGHLQQDSSIEASVDIDEMLSKHFAVLGTTGVGKSSAVALILQQMLRARPDLRIFLLDVHNEYGRCFGDRAHVVNPGNLRLPFWLFNFEEIVDVFFGGRPVVEEEVEILSEVIPLAKAAYTQYRSRPTAWRSRRSMPRASATPSTRRCPIGSPDLLTMIDERMGKLENRSSRMNYHRLITRIETVSNDPALRLHVRERQCRRRHDGGMRSASCSGCRPTASR